MRNLLHVAAGVALLALLAAQYAGADDGQFLDGRLIALEAGDHMSRYAPVVLPYHGPAPEKKVNVVEDKTGKRFPVTIRDDEFVFVPEGAMPGTKHMYLVETHDPSAPMVVQIDKVEGADQLEVRIRDEHLTTYHYSNENKKPFLWPVYAEGGVTITRDWPMGDQELSDDHKHHKSLWSSYGNVNGADCWGEGDNSGYQVSGDVQWGSGDAYGWIAAKNTWQNNNREPVVSEEREYRFYASPAKARILDLILTFTASYGDVLFKDTKEGGIMTARVRDIITEEQGGTITNAAGGVGAGQCWGKPAAWCDYSGSIGDAGLRGIAIFDHPTNLRHPTTWHVRDYGLMGANCFGYSHFTKSKENGDYTLKDGESVTFRYRVYIHTGGVDLAKVADRYADYAAPPEAAWVQPAEGSAASGAGGE